MRGGRELTAVRVSESESLPSSRTFGVLPLCRSCLIQNRINKRLSLNDKNLIRGQVWILLLVVCKTKNYTICIAILKGYYSAKVEFLPRRELNTFFLEIVNE